MMRVTNKMSENYNVYNINNNKSGLDALNNQMSTRKKYDNPMEDPLTSIRSLRYRGSLSELTQYLEKNVADAVSWTDSTQTAIDTAKELMRSLKAEYTSAANGTNENTDRWTYYNNMVNVVNEYFSTGNTTNENRYIFSGARTGDSLTFSDKNFADRAKERGEEVTDDHVDTYKYRGIKEYFKLEDVESYSYTARNDRTYSSGSSGITEDEITNLEITDVNLINETKVENVEAYRIRLAYKNLDPKNDTERELKDLSYTYTREDGQTETRSTNVKTLEITDPSTIIDKTLAEYTTNIITDDSAVDSSQLKNGVLYYNKNTGTLTADNQIKNYIDSKAKAGGSGYEVQINGTKVEVVDDPSKATDPSKDYYIKKTGEFKLSDTTASAASVNVSVVNTKTPETTSSYNIVAIYDDSEINQELIDGNPDTIYLNTTTGNLIFSSAIKDELTDYLSKGFEISFQYNKSVWETGDVKPEHYFDCIDAGLSNTIIYEDHAHKKEYPNSHEQDIFYNVGEGADMKVNTNASDVFNIDARRDLDELYDALTAKDEAEKKLNLIKSMKEDTVKYGDIESQEKLEYLGNAVNKELEYISTKLNSLLSNGITKASEYFDHVNLAGTDMGTTVNRLTLIRNRLTEHKSTTTAQASENENIDISTVAVEVNSATLSYNAALQVTGKISQQSLVNFL